MNYIQHDSSDDSPQIGDLAINEDGILGVITETLSGKKCTGRNAYDDSKEWESSNPVVVGFINLQK